MILVGLQSGEMNARLSTMNDTDADELVSDERLKTITREFVDWLVLPVGVGWKYPSFFPPYCFFFTYT